MKLLKWIVILYVALIFCYTNSYTQSRLPGIWSISIYGNYNSNFGLSEAMRGTSSEFRNDIIIDYNNSKFPFGDDDTRNICFGVGLSYWFPQSPVSVYFKFSNVTYFLQKPGFLNIYTDKANMLIFSFTPGVEYSFGKSSELWNFLIRFGISLNTITGDVTYFNNKTNLSPAAFRGGFETEFGGRLNIPSTPLSLEATANYTNANFIGKSYVKPSVQPPSTLGKEN